MIIKVEKVMIMLMMMVTMIVVMIMMMMRTMMMSMMMIMMTDRETDRRRARCYIHVKTCGGFSEKKKRKIGTLLTSASALIKNKDIRH